MTTKKTEVLDDLKKMQNKINKQLLVISLKELKNYAKEVLRMKHGMNYTLDKLNLNEKDKKAVIDWVNNLPDVQLSDDDESDIEVEIDKKFKSNKKKAEKLTLDVSALREQSNHYEVGVYTGNTTTTFGDSGGGVFGVTNLKLNSGWMGTDEATIKWDASDNSVSLSDGTTISTGTGIDLGNTPSEETADIDGTYD